MNQINPDTKVILTDFSAVDFNYDGIADDFRLRLGQGKDGRDEFHIDVRYGAAAQTNDWEHIETFRTGSQADKNRVMTLPGLNDADGQPVIYSLVYDRTDGTATPVFESLPTNPDGTIDQDAYNSQMAKYYASLQN